jgi:hypothetical protein
MVKFDGATFLRAGAGLVTAFMIAIIGWAFGAGDFTAEFEVISTLAWGKQVIGDLYAGILLMSVFIFLVERNWLRTLLWAAPIFVLGNVWAAIWVTWRAPEILRRLRNS